MDEVLLKMSQIVEQNLKNHKDDFYVYDRTIYGRMYDKDRFIWITRDNGTQICGIYKDVKDKDIQNAIRETARIYYNHFGIQNREYMHCKFYLVVKGKSVEPITLEQFNKFCE